MRRLGPAPGLEEGACGEEVGRAEQAAVEEEVRGSWKAKANSYLPFPGPLQGHVH